MDFTKLQALLNTAKNEILISGITPLLTFFEKKDYLAKTFASYFAYKDNLKITILYESGTEIFNQSLFYGNSYNDYNMSSTILNFHKNIVLGGEKGRPKVGFIGDVVDACKSGDLPDEEKAAAIDRIKQGIVLKSFNLRQSINVIKVDDTIWYSPIIMGIPSLDMYTEVEKTSLLYSELLKYVNFIVDPTAGGVFLSEPSQELIELYDLDDYPRGIYPRDAFYSLNYQRYSIWGFVFNRKGELLLHQRSKHTKDNRLLWDKSTGGHVDLREISSTLTAKRELIEELMLPEAEFTKYVSVDLGDIVDFGDWNPRKGIQKYFRNALDCLDDSDWVLFRSTEKNGTVPLRVKRISMRKMHDKNDNVSIKETRFISDVFLYVSPSGYIDTPEQMKEKVKHSEVSGAAEDHKLVSIYDLYKWIKSEKDKNNAENVFTDDLLHICKEYRWLLEEFSEFVKLTFNVD